MTTAWLTRRRWKLAVQREIGRSERPVGWVLFRNAGMWAASRRPAANSFWEAEVSEVEERSLVYSCGYMARLKTNPQARCIITAHSWIFNQNTCKVLEMKKSCSTLFFTFLVRVYKSQCSTFTVRKKHTDLSLDSNLYITFVGLMLITTDNRWHFLLPL